MSTRRESLRPRSPRTAHRTSARSRSRKKPSSCAANSLASGAGARNRRLRSPCSEVSAMRFVRSVSMLLLLAAPLAAQAKKGTKTADPDQLVKGGGNLPAGWSAQTDEKGKEADVKFVVMDKGYHVTLGPATILWRAADKTDGSFHAVALFTQPKPTAHAEGYGLFVGGQGLGGESEKYTYFLIRQDGKFLIKKRDGASTSNITSTWTAHPAIVLPN